MEDVDRDVLLDNEHAWSPLLLVIGTVLQAVLLILAFLVILIVPGLASDAVESVRSVVGTVTWMNGLSAFVASLLAMFIVRRRLRSIAMLVTHSVVPAIAVSVVNIVPTYAVRGWVPVMMVIIFAVGASILSSLIYAFLLRRGDYVRVTESCSP